ncbi:MATE family efflux transporter [Mucilaginibacter humi]|uniref:MATE family efflux transporter n=1 Tax=Mucilaginibacter humi TaxID=2732510 RepID=UPI001FE326B6|nr:MATE family efflux transporter [Mucilaginibacter humi]
MITAKYNAIFMGAVMIIFLCFSNHIIRIFTQDAAVVKYGTQALQVFGSAYIFYGIGMVMTRHLTVPAIPKHLPDKLYLFLADPNTIGLVPV